MVALKKGDSSGSVMLGYVIFILLFCVFQAGADKAILLALSLSPLLFILKSSRKSGQKPMRLQSSVTDKIMLYVAIALFFGFIFLLDSQVLMRGFLQSLTQDDLLYIPEIFLFGMTFFAFLELVGRQRDRS
jgi:hypothetical protein